MAFIDYGALLRVDGKFINKDTDLFMDASDTGYVCDTAIDLDGSEIKVDGNYYIYAGDENLLICFYKTGLVIISGGKVIKRIWRPQFASETLKDPDCRFPLLSIRRLDPEKRKPHGWEHWEEYAAERYGTPLAGYLPLNKLQRGEKIFRTWMRQAKRHRRAAKRKYYYSARYLAEWDHGGRHYEVIFGYGIDPSSDVRADIRTGDNYDFSDTERKIIDDWFASAD